MKPKEPPIQSSAISKEDSVGWFVWLANLLMWLTTPFLRINAGIDQPGWDALIVACVLPLYAIEMKSPLVLLYWKAWLVALLLYRLFRNAFELSYYIGESWLVGIFVEDERTASLVEGLLVLAVGYAMPDKGMRVMLMASGAAKVVYEMMHRRIEERKRIARNNARYQMENEMETYR
jgi:hypothetical protein